MLRHTKISAHTVALKAENAQQSTSANLATGVQKLDTKQLEDLKTLFDTAHLNCKQERFLNDYPLELKYLTRNSTRKFEVNRYSNQDACKQFILSMGDDITA